MRLALNLLTVSVTVLVLAALVLPARHVLQAARPPPAMRLPDRLFGVYVDPWHIDDWSREVGATPSMIAKFEAFSNNRALDKCTDEAQSRGITHFLVSWEPWRPVPTGLGIAAQFRPQLG